MGIIDLLKKKSAENIGIRILSPVNEHIKELLLPKDVVGKYEVIKNIIGQRFKSKTI